jgi:hypothetical protein
VSNTQLTVEQFKQVLPKQIRGGVSQELIDKVNQSISDPIFAEQFRDNILGYAHILRDGKFKMDDYLNAVKYVSYKLMGDSNVAAYTKTFPARYQGLINKNATDKDISAYVAAYNKNKLVNLIYEQSLIPSHVLNADIYQKAINTQAELMTHASSEKVRTDAANSLLHHLKPPETTKIELEVGTKENSVLADLRETTRDLAAQQKKLIEQGILNTQEVAKSKLVRDIEEADYEEVDSSAH